MPFLSIRFCCFIFIISNIHGHNKLCGIHRNRDGTMGDRSRDHICGILQQVFRNIPLIPDHSRLVQVPVHNKLALVVHNTHALAPVRNMQALCGNNGDNNKVSSQHSCGSRGRQHLRGKLFVL